MEQIYFFHSQLDQQLQLVRQRFCCQIRQKRFSSLPTACSRKPSIIMWDFKFSRDDHPWWWRQYAPLKRRSTIILHGSTSQKTILNVHNYLLSRCSVSEKSYFVCYSFRAIESNKSQSSLSFYLTHQNIKNTNRQLLMWRSLEPPNSVNLNRFDSASPYPTT
jgi:hypothetical protein